MSVNKNSLGVINMKVVKTIEFLSDFIGQTLTVWGGLGGLYCIEEFKELRFADEKTLFKEKGIVLTGSRSCNTFAVECNKGFGFSPLGSDESYWIDKINEEDTAVVVYERQRVGDE